MTANRLLDALDFLTIEHVVSTELDDGKRHYERHAALIKQLRDAIASSIGGGAGGKAARERIPLDADAMVKYEQIETAILHRFRDAEIGVPHLLPEDNLRAWHVAFMIHATPADVESLADTLESWKKTIEEKLSPPTILEIAGQECPKCGFAWYDTVLNVARPDTRRPGDDKWNWVDKERKPALTTTYRPDMRGGLTDSFAKCGNCNHVWMGVAGIRELAELLNKPASDAEGTVGA